MLNCVVGSDKTAAAVNVDGTKIDGIELTEVRCRPDFHSFKI